LFYVLIDSVLSLSYSFSYFSVTAIVKITYSFFSYFAFSVTVTVNLYNTGMTVSTQQS